MTTVCIHQPDFVPWLGFFHRLCIADIYIVLDNVQFIRRGWTHRDKIKEAGQERWLTIPVIKTGRFDQLIADVEIDDSQPWRHKHLRTIEAAYAGTSAFAAIFPALRALYAQGHTTLMAFNLALLEWLSSTLGIRIDTRMASALPAGGRQNERLINLVHAVGGTVYLTGTGARDYLDEAMFNSAGLTVRWQRFQHPAYAQTKGPFIPNLSTLDPLFNLGPDHTRRILDQAD
jgi:hypothetical protein